MARIIKHVGPCRIKKRNHHFQSLVTAILSQQISAAAARTVIQNFRDQLGTQVIRPKDLAHWDVERLRSVGISRQKAGFLCDLAHAVNQEQLKLSALSRLNNQRVIEKLTEVKGIGTWTAHMFLIFSLGRADVLPTGDLAIRTAIRDQYELDELPDSHAMSEIAKPWEPYRSIACWYLWRTIEP